MIVLAHLPEWARYRYPWYIQTFNIAKWICASLAVYFVVRRRSSTSSDISSQVGRLAAGRRDRGSRLRRSSTTRCSPTCSASRAASRTARAASSPSAASRPRSCSPLLGVGLAAVWELEPRARAARARAARRRLPLAPAPEPRDGGHGSTRRPSSSTRATSRARSPAELERAKRFEPPTLDPARRPRPAARGEQHLRPPRRRRGASRRRRRAPLAAAAVRHSRPVRRRGVRDRSPGSEPRGGPGDRGADPRWPSQSASFRLPSGRRSVTRDDLARRRDPSRRARPSTT